MHHLWPETEKLLKQEMARRNPHGRALLNAKGDVLYERSAERKYDAVSDAHGYLCKRAGVKIGFQQFRKIGASAMERLGHAHARRLYKAGSVEDGDKVYVLDCFETLTPHLMKWGDELRRDGVLW